MSESDETAGSTEKPAPVPAPRFREGACGAQTHIINDAFGFAYMQGLLDVILTTAQLIPGENGLEPCNEIVARLRFDLNTAKAFRDNLDRAIQGLSAPPKDKVN